MQCVVLNVLERVFVLNKYRIKFCKKDRLRFIGHLDLLKMFQRIVKRAGLPISYSKGFNPHQLMSFAAPLPLGTQSIAEYVDIRLEKDVDCNEIKNLLNAIVPNGMEILEVTKLDENSKNSAAILEAAEYEITLDFKEKDFFDKIKEMMSLESLMIERISKKRTKVIDIKPDIYNIEDISDNNYSKLKVLIATGSIKNLKPELLVEYIYKHMGRELNAYKIKYKRTALFTCEDGKFISL